MPFRPTLIAFAKSPPKSTRAWLASHYRHPYVKKWLSNPGSYRAPSALKVLEIDAKWGRFLSHPDVHTVVDLGAAPGGWSQVVAGKLGWDIPRPTFEPQSVALRSKYQSNGNIPHGSLQHGNGDSDNTRFFDALDLADIFDPRMLVDILNLTRR